MTTIVQQSVACGHCGTENEVIELGSTNSFGSMDLDMRPPPMERDTLAQQIHRCQGCGYCAPDLEEPVGADGLLGSDDYRALLADKGYPELARMFIAYGFLAESSGDLVGAAWAYRSAAWVCDDAVDSQVDSAIKCRNAVLRLIEGLRLNGHTFTDDPITDSILKLDLLRRSGQHSEVMACVRALSEKELPEMLRSISAFQQRLAAAGDSACYRVSDVLDSATEPDA